MNPDRMDAQYRQFGAKDKDMAHVKQAQSSSQQTIVVLAPNWPAFLLFTSCSRQWTSVMDPKGRLINLGLQFDQVEIRARHFKEIRALDEDETDRLWQDITALQNDALEMMAELRDE